MEVYFEKSKNKKFKQTAIFYKDNKKIKTTNYGYAGMSDYTIHKDKERRKRYLSRHEKDLKTNDYKRAGYLSYYILWGPSTSLEKNINSYVKRFNLKRIKQKK